MNFKNNKKGLKSLLLQNKQNIVFFIYYQGYPLENASTLILSTICEQYKVLIFLSYFIISSLV